MFISLSRDTAFPRTLMPAPCHASLLARLPRLRRRSAAAYRRPSLYSDGTRLVVAVAARLPAAAAGRRTLLQLGGARASRTAPPPSPAPSRLPHGSAPLPRLSASASRGAPTGRPPLGPRAGDVSAPPRSALRETAAALPRGRRGSRRCWRCAHTPTRDTPTHTHTHTPTLQLLTHTRPPMTSSP